MTLCGIVKGNFIETDDGRKFLLPIRGGDEFGNPEMLIGDLVTKIERKSIASLQGLRVEFEPSEKDVYGLNLKIIGK